MNGSYNNLYMEFYYIILAITFEILEPKSYCNIHL